MSSISPSLEDSLKEHFNKVMKCDSIPLLADFDVYKKSLPVRESFSSDKVFIPLYELPHWVHDQDLKSFANQLKNKSFLSRNHVKYLSVPPHSGKTSCILPAFLKNTKSEGGFTHYFYFTFDNNDGRIYENDGEISNSSIIALRQGASFI